MAEFRHRVAQNVVGKFYVDDTCIYCDLCHQTAPTVFRYEQEWGWASVFHQPSTPEEFRLAMESVDGCPTESIGADGDAHDWSVPGRAPLSGEAQPAQEEPWWKRILRPRRSSNQAIQRTAGRSAITHSMTPTPLVLATRALARGR